MTTNIIFFELTDYALLRFPFWISKELKKQHPELFFIYIHLYKFKNKQVSLELLPENSTVYSLNGKIQKIDNILEIHRANSTIITFAIRPPEFYVIKKAHNLGLPSNLVQHGIFVPFMKREVSYFLGEFKKMSFYLRSTYALSKISDIGTILSLLEIYRVYIKGKKTISQSIFQKFNILPNKVFVYSEYWKSYFIKNYGFKDDQFKLTGSPDLQNFTTLEQQDKKNAICYICQTLVEDGRLSTNQFAEFLNTFNSVLKDSDVLYIKLHPRTDVSLYKILTKRPNTHLIKDNLPNCKKYIGHYSTLLMLPLALTGNVFLWEFNGHEIPEYFARSTKFRGSNRPTLLTFMALQEDFISNKKLIEYYFNYPNINPYKIICEYI